MATGITVSDEAVARFDAFKVRKAGDVGYIVLGIAKDSVIIEKEHPKSMKIDEFMATLDANPKYILIDYDYTTTDGRPADKIILISWIPDTAKVKDKMKFSGTKEAVKSAFQGIAVNMNATDMSECTNEEILANCTKI